MVTWSLLLLLLLLPLVKQMRSQTGECAGRHTRWCVVTGRRVDRGASCTGKLCGLAYQVDNASLDGFGVPRGRAGSQAM
jgi:hypothetical protein